MTTIFQERFQNGDLVYASQDLLSDGEVPGTTEGEVLVPKGTRGMVVQTGHLENQPETAIYLVRFEDADKQLGDPLGCLTDEITQRQSGSGEAESTTPPSVAGP